MIVPLFRVFRRRVVHNPPAPLRIAVLMAAILAYGTTGFVFFELPVKPDVAWSDALWWSLVTMTTVGYGDIFPATAGGRFLVAAPLMLFGIGLLGYVLSLAATTLIEAKSREISGMGQVSLRDHLIVVNFPHLEKVTQVVDELRADTLFRDKEIVLIDEDLQQIPPTLHERGVLFVRGNPTRDDTLDRANLDRASHAVILSKKVGDTHSDDLALAVTLAIEARKKSIRTIAECVDQTHAGLLRKAGCDSVICSGSYEAHFLTNEVLHPGMQEVIEELLTIAGQQLHFVPASPGTFAQAAERARALGHIAIGVRRGGKSEINVPTDRAVKDGEFIVTIGVNRIEKV